MNSRYSSEVNLDILCIMRLVEIIGWSSLKEQSIQRILYLSKVLYYFCNEEDDLFYYYHFSKSISGPYSELVPNSIIFLYSNQFILKDEDGNYKPYRPTPGKINNQKERWFKTIILILGKYGEERIFGFTINDPLYLEAVQSNSQKELNTNIENKTIKVLNEFKTAFEQAIVDTSSISIEEYLDLYFEYVFGQIIKSK